MCALVTGVQTCALPISGRILAAERSCGLPVATGVIAIQPLAIAAVLHRPPPAFVRQIPGDRLGKPGSEIARRPIAQPARDLALVNRLTAVVAGAVGDIGLEFGRRAALGGGRVRKAES